MSQVDHICPLPGGHQASLECLSIIQLYIPTPFMYLCLMLKNRFHGRDPMDDGHKVSDK